MKNLMFCALLAFGLHTANSNAAPVTVDVTIDPGSVGSTIPGGTLFQLPDLVGIDIANDDLTINVLFADGKVLGIVSIINAILQVTTNPMGGFVGVELGDSALIGSDGSGYLLGSITNGVDQTVNLFGSGPFDLAAVRYGGLSGGGVITSATFRINELVLVNQGPSEIPVPPSLALVGIGLLCLSMGRRRTASVPCR
jgi:hypothetical protein